MRVNQISVFLENKSGRLVYVTQALFDANVNICAHSLADTAEFGILRMIVDDPQTAYEALKAKRMTVSITEVLAVVIPNVPGGLNQVMQIFTQKGLNVDYSYVFMGTKNNQAVAIFKVADLDNAYNALQDTDLKVLNNEELMEM